MKNEISKVGIISGSIGPAIKEKTPEPIQPEKEDK